MNNNNYRVILALILLLGAFLRIYGLGDESFWLDEADTIEYTKSSVAGIIEGTYVNSTLLPQFFGKGAGSVPLYYLLANYWTKIFGLSEFKLRLISALFGILSIYLIFLAGKLLFNYRVGLIAAFILAINHQHIYFSQEARMYSMLAALTLFSVLLLFHALSSNKTGYWVIFVITNAALLYTHYFSFFILLFEGVYLVAYIHKYKSLFKQIFFSWTAVFLLYLPWVPALISQVSHGSPIGRILGGPTISNFITTLIGFNSWVSPDFETRAALSTLNFLDLPASGWILIISVIAITLLFGLAFILGLAYPKNGKFITALKDNRLVLLLLWLLIPVLVPLLISAVFPENAVFGSIMHILFASPAYYLIAALGISRAYQFLPLFLILLTIFSVFPLYSYYTNFDKQQLREAAEYIKDNILPNEPIFVHRSNVILPFRYYYPNLTDVSGVNGLNELQSGLAGKSSFWVLLSMEKFSDPQGTINQYLDSNYALTQKIDLIDVRVVHYRHETLS